ncbi:MAG: COG3014 family protein [Bacteroidales bacterium]
MQKNYTFLIIALLPLFLLSSCATYYQQNLKFQSAVGNGELSKAKDMLDKDKSKTGKNRVLYLFNKGWLNWMMNENAESNIALDEADKMIEDYQKNYGLEALALITNPNVKPYKPEDFEVVMVNYFKALNYLNTGKYSDALVEVRRINEKLNQLNDKYPDHKNRYQDDAFAHLIMGLIYDANREYNDAFIAYRNALNVYENSYVKNFNMQVPEQLKWDLMRAAYRTGFNEELRFYEQKFNLKYENKPNEGGELVFFWHNGLGPVKSEWSINFTKTGSDNGFVTFANEQYGLSFPIYIGDKSDNEKSGFSKLSFLRIAFPKYLERKPFFSNAEITANGKTYPLQYAQDINGIAFKTLNDRMLREMGNAILRLATKKAIEAAARKENEDLGSAIGIVNALTEKTDTRNWQTLPYSISYTRIAMPVGENSIDFSAFSSGAAPKKEMLKFNILKGKTVFFNYSNLESFPPVEK